MYKTEENKLFHEYFKEWIELYKVDSVRHITLQKYYMSNQRIEELAPDLKICDLTRQSYQKLLNAYALTHEKQTTMDFHHQLKGAIFDAIDDGLIKKNPTRKIVIKGKLAKRKKAKFLNQFEVQQLLKQLKLSDKINWDWFILLLIKTGLRFSEALALTPNDFDFSKYQITIDKTWNYKEKLGCFQLTKNESSKRKILLDQKISMQFKELIENKSLDKPIFVTGRVFNSTINNRLEVLCKKAKVPIISIHGLRHTHASMLLFAGVSIASVAKRLGHSSMTTTQEIYLHIIQELENQDNDKILKHLATLI